MNPEHYMHTNIHYMVAAGWPIVDFIFNGSKDCAILFLQHYGPAYTLSYFRIGNCEYARTGILVDSGKLQCMHWTAILYSYSTPDPVSHLFSIALSVATHTHRHG